MSAVRNEGASGFWQLALDMRGDLEVLTLLDADDAARLVKMASRRYLVVVLVAGHGSTLALSTDRWEKFRYMADVTQEWLSALDGDEAISVTNVAELAGGWAAVGRSDATAH